ncbi:hypothetical protein ACH5RR_011998 [Cinchona calisaya]|uniref:Uncharacterized protein n=1 Tax=Cinchona calisaya TaxID=153742 RepID=A0ABD3AA39_9GENT
MDENGKISLCKDILIPYDDKESSLNRMDKLLAIEDIKTGMTNWTTKITVILADSQGSRFQAIMFNDAIPIMILKLQLYKTYLISNAEVRLIPPSFQSDGIDMQWVISTETVGEELTDEQNMLTSEFKYTEFKNLAQFLDSTTQTNKELPLEKVHEDMKSKTFIAQVKAGKTRESDAFQRYTISYYFEDIQGQPITRTIAHQSSQNTAIEPSKNLITNAVFEPSDNLITTTQTGEKQCSSSTVRVCLAKMFDGKESSKNPTDGESEDDELMKGKKPRLT